MTSETAQIITTSLYILAAATWFSAATSSIQGRLVGSLLLLSAAADRYFEFGNEIVHWLRQLAVAGDWYAQRRWFQTAVIVIVVVLLGAAVRRSTSISMRSALLLTLLAFYFVRAISNHYIDDIMGASLYGLKFHWCVEWTLLLALITYTFRDACSRWKKGTATPAN